MGTNYYVPADPTCNNDAHTRVLHIGKSSLGWKFGFRAYDDLGLISWQAWRDFASGRHITNEYGDTITLEQLVDIVENRRTPSGEEGPYCRIDPSPGCKTRGFGGRWTPPDTHRDFEGRPLEFHDPAGYDFSRSEFS